MRILVIGASGTIGRSVVEELAKRHQVIAAGRKSGAERVDITRPESIRELFKRIGKVDAVVTAAGDARFEPLAKLTDDDFRFSQDNKLMGQVNVVRYGLEHVNDQGSFTVTSGVLARTPMPGSAAVSLVNAGLEGFVRAAAIEAPRGIRVNVVSPPWVTETLRALGMDPTKGRSAADVAKLYARSVEGRENGAVIEF